MRSVAVGVLGAGAACLAVVAGAQVQSSRQREYSARIEVIARSVLVDVLDDTGHAVDEVPAGLLTLVEDGVPRPILEVRRRVVDGGEGLGAPTATAGATGGRVATPAPRFVLVAIDPVTLGRRSWAAAIEQLQGAAESLVRIGPVDVVALTTPTLVAATATRDPAAVRAALSRIAAEVAPLDRFYLGRSRAVQEVQQMLQDPTARGRDLVQRVLGLQRELAPEEEMLLRDALERLRAALAQRGRPLVAVWAAQGDPDTAAFVRAQLPSWLSPADEMQLRGGPLGSLGTIEATWARWAADGVSVVSWTRQADSLVFETGSLQHPVAGNPLTALGNAPLALFDSLAGATGGAVAQNQPQLRAGLAAAGGRLELVFQTDNDAAGWRILRIDASLPGWLVRYPPRILVAGSGTREPAPDRQPIVLAVDLTPVRSPSDRPGREKIVLQVLVDLAPLRERLAPDAAARFAIKLLATPPRGNTVSREVEVRMAALPEEGRLRYEASLEVPAGTTGYSVEVREETTGALGAAGPVDAAPALGTEAAPAPPVAPLPVASPGVFTDFAEVRIGQVRFLLPEVGPPAENGIRVVWRRHDQRLVRVAGGAGSSLELGIAIDVSESVTAEREAFARAATAAATRLLGAGDRVFRVDFGTLPRYLGSSRGAPGTLFVAGSAASPEKTALIDALRYALDRFEGKDDRAALIVLTDGVQTTGGTDWRELIRVARSKAIPIVVVLTPTHEGRTAARVAVPGEALVNGPANPLRQTPGMLQEDLQSGVAPDQASRFVLARVATATGGLVINLVAAESATEAWAEVEKALARQWVAVFEPSDPKLDPREVEVRTASGKVLRPGG